ncbi:MAG: YceD family protein [Streptococcaceae bacterium]|jgi:uncharacterized protein|nr:YceD family protein [Streptococcaceae bacterium]
MKWTLEDIEKSGSIKFDSVLNLEEALKLRDSEILACSEINVLGSVKFDKGFYDLVFTATYTLTLPSSRSLSPVTHPATLDVFETYVKPGTATPEDEEDLILVAEDDEISLDNALLDNILLEIPTRRLTPEEEKENKLPSGKDWQVLSEEDYDALKKTEKLENSPFAALGDIFDEK